MQQSDLSLAYGEVREARVCAAIDPRTEIGTYWAEIERTEHLLFEGWQAGLGAQLSSAKIFWEETDEVIEKVCPFQMGDPPEETSLQLFNKANDALEAAIAAEGN